MARRKRVPLPSSDTILAGPVSENALAMEYMSSVYPIGFGFSKEGNVAVFTHGHGEGEEASVIEHLITPKQLERIIEIAQQTLDNLGRHTLGIKTRG